MAIEAAGDSRPFSFLVAGGHAVIAHGHARMTVDLDRIIRRPDSPAWRSMMGDLAYMRLRAQPTFLRLNEPNAASFPLGATCPVEFRLT